MFRTLLTLSATLFSVASVADVYICKIEKQTGSHVVVVNSTLPKATSSTLLAIADKAPAGTFSSITGAIVITTDAKSSTLVYQNNIKMNWDKIDPEKQCFRNNPTTTLTLKPVGKKYEGEYQLRAQLEIHPKKKDCLTPDLQVPAPQPIVCEPAQMDVN